MKTKELKKLRQSYKKEKKRLLDNKMNNRIYYPEPKINKLDLIMGLSALSILSSKEYNMNIMTTADVARKLGVTTSCVRSMVNRGCPTISQGETRGPGNGHRFSWEEVEKWIKSERHEN